MLRNGPRLFSGVARSGAANRTRTCDPVITNDVLYQLSYCGEPNASLGPRPETPAPDIGHSPDWQEKRGRFSFLTRFLDANRKPASLENATLIATPASQKSAPAAGLGI